MTIAFPDLAPDGTPLDTPENLEALLVFHGVSPVTVGKRLGLVFNRTETRFLNRALWEAKVGWLSGVCARAGLPASAMAESLFYVAAKHRDAVLSCVGGVQ